VKRIAIILLLVFVGLCLCFIYSNRLPRETKLIQNFFVHRAAFEQLRNMLEADTQLRRLADWGVETDKGIFPKGSGFPSDRFNKYLDLLKEIGGRGVDRSEGVHADPFIVLWAAGFGGDTVHTGICWMDEVPTNQISSLDGYYHDHAKTGGRGEVYRHIDGNWYLCTDLWSQQ
jgi:hypothetical protein